MHLVIFIINARFWGYYSNYGVPSLNLSLIFWFYMTDVFKKVSKILHESNLSLTSAESCTGGWIAKKMTDLAGSSSVFERGFVTYSNESKQEMLDVKQETLKIHGAVSEAVVNEMAIGALKNSNANISVAVSGIAGPGGGSVDKPVGTVCFAWCLQYEEPICKTKCFEGNRKQVRKQSVKYAIKGVINLISD